MKCANPECRVEANYFRDGSVHWIDDPGKDEGERIIQRAIWLCAECTEIYVVDCWRPPGEQLRLRRDAGAWMSVVEIACSSNAPEEEQELVAA